MNSVNTKYLMRKSRVSVKIYFMNKRENYDPSERLFLKLPKEIRDHGDHRVAEN